MRLIVRREQPHPDAQLSLFEKADGWRYQVVTTNTTAGQLVFLEARHRAHCPGARTGSATRWTPAWDASPPELRDQHRLGPARRDQRRPHRVAAAARTDTPAGQSRTQSTALRLLHVPARLTTGVRRCRLRIPSNWPWATAIVSAFERIAAIPAPG